MRDFFWLLFWIVIIGLLVGGIQISQDTEKMGAPYKVGDEVALKTFDDVNGFVTNYFIVKIRWDKNEKWRYEMYTVEYKDDNGGIQTWKGKPGLLKDKEDVPELYKPDVPEETDDYVKSLIEGTN